MQDQANLVPVHIFFRVIVFEIGIILHIRVPVGISQNLRVKLENALKQYSLIEYEIHVWCVSQVVQYQKKFTQDTI